MTGFVTTNVTTAGLSSAPRFTGPLELWWPTAVRLQARLAGGRRQFGQRQVLQFFRVEFPDRLIAERHVLPTPLAGAAAFLAEPVRVCVLGFESGRRIEASFFAVHAQTAGLRLYLGRCIVWPGSRSTPYLREELTDLLSLVMLGQVYPDCQLELEERVPFLSARIPA